MENLNKFSTKGGEFTKSGEQIGIGAIQDKGDYVEVEVLSVCSKNALKDRMRDIAKETGKTVKAEFNGVKGDEQIVVEPEKIICQKK